MILKTYFFLFFPINDVLFLLLIRLEKKRVKNLDWIYTYYMYKYKNVFSSHPQTDIYLLIIQIYHYQKSMSIFYEA